MYLSEKKALHRLEIYSNGKPSPSAAFPENSSVTLRFFVSRSLGASDFSVYLKNDENGEESKIKCRWISMKNGHDIYETRFKLKSIGLYFLYGSYKTVSGHASFVFPGGDTSLPITVYKTGFTTPDWFSGGIMYQIFPDRFAKSEKHGVYIKPDTTYKESWYEDIPDYPEKPGDAFANNCFFGGSLYGISEKLDYLLSLGVNTIYLNPIFDAASNHKYDTGDYLKIDEAFGGEKAFKKLISEAKKRNMHVILDGVFNHTGDDSVYFNKYGKYKSVGAYQSTDSPYSSWYDFKSFPDEYSSWWGIKILPSINKESLDFRSFICGEDGVLRHYLKLGIDGWRLDVADELSDGFLYSLNSAIKKENKNALIIGEVWEDASYKIAYGKRRKYFLGNQLDCVMNYPLRSAITEYVISGKSDIISSAVASLYLHYPKCVSDVQMNHLGTHDTERILNVLSGDGSSNLKNSELAEHRLSLSDRAYAKELLKLAAFLLYTLPGVPSIYYGDEIGMEGGRDPFNRMPFPWGKEDSEILEFFRKLGSLRRSIKAFKEGLLSIIYEGNGLFIYRRDKVICAVNRGPSRIVCHKRPFCDLFSKRDAVLGENGLYKIKIEENSFIIFNG